MESSCIWKAGEKPCPFDGAVLKLRVLTRWVFHWGTTKMECLTRVLRERERDRERRHNVEARSRRFGGEQVQDVAGSSGGGDGELCRQHGGQEPLHHIGEGDQGEAQPVAVGLRR